MNKETSTPEDPKNKNSAQAWWQPGLIMFARMSTWIVAPVLLGTILGKWLDKRLDSEPWAFISVVGLAFILSMVALVLEVSKQYKKIEKDKKEDGQ